ncbi:hypothetical protein FTV88_0113 [Heliorestis convoluta]|uniref:Uncharacterized protein n=1 Tax=Heliorestis convoluta TaxID=356322 RepID=A0A5Q2MZD3_9FIRM|nr:hypothetical protein FTV88_0113 [Heliorestis convoluta]
MKLRKEDLFMSLLALAFSFHGLWGFSYLGRMDKKEEVLRTSVSCRRS